MSWEAVSIILINYLGSNQERSGGEIGLSRDEILISCLCKREIIKISI